MSSNFVPDEYSLEVKKAEMEKQLMELYRDRLAIAGPKERKQIMKEIQEALESFAREEANKIIKDGPWIR
jgi:hypothetical protein